MVRHMPRLADPDPPLPVLFSASQALAAGLTRGQIQQRLRSGRWVRLATGSYRRSDWAPGFPADEHARARLNHAHRAIAAVRRNPGCVIGFQSAAVLHQMPLYSRLPTSVVLIAPPGHWSGGRDGLLIRCAALRPMDVTGGAVPLTTPARTWLDVSRTLTLADGLAAGDGGLRRGVLQLPAVSRTLLGIEGTRGCRKAALAAEHLSGVRETALESGSWAYFVEHRLPLPRMQVEFRGDDGRHVGRVDFYWDEARLVGECDGRMKYTGPDANYQEKRREDGLRELGLGVTRWGWTDLRDGRLAERLRRRLAERPPSRPA